MVDIRGNGERSIKLDVPQQGDTLFLDIIIFFECQASSDRTVLCYLAHFRQ